ncbi:hypothetical protein KUCAC02_025393 [Chaenocephalus aceratus]|uniref:Uncharacterized protein n=1 Tax=Chaenocephalus aceratus TaxID=36190 RepID=A0ACB9VUF1_CHAAC|nr:hypothetical protein KUCAC02_025393 [Chaenocephalus aceratus]
MMDSRICLAAVLLLFGLATVFAQSSPDQVNFQTLIITLSVLGAILIIALMICLFCCCKCENFGSKRTEAKLQKQANKTRTKQEERKAEMNERHNDIRKKYGLSGQNPYSKFA